MSTLNYTILALPLCTLIIWLAFRKRQRLPLPPSPPAEPMLGHMRLIPDAQVIAEVFNEWSQKYGDIFSLRVPGKTIIVLGSEQAATDLLEKRSAIYSSRPRLGYFNAIGWGDTVTFAPYGPFHTLQRKLYHDSFARNVVSQYHEDQQRQANILLKGLLDDPKDYDRRIQRFAGGIVSEIAYGHRIDSFDDNLFNAGEKLCQIVGKAGTPSLLDIHPIFAHLPSWAPGAWFVNFIKESKPCMDSILFGEYRQVEEQMKAGVAKPSYTSKNLSAMDEEHHDPEQYRALQLSAVTIFSGGFETTWHAVTIFLATMLLHPEVQKRAQEEIDRVVGRDRLPEISDRGLMPYLQCVMHETMRWQPVLPIGLAHQLMTDDTYRGMHIPKDSIIIANSRSITWDESKFRDARSFRPERFLPKPEGYGETFLPNIMFGWGRRVCAGQFLAENSVWVVMARILAVFDITPLKGADGRPMKPDVKFKTTTTRHVEPFQCNIIPRDEVARSLIMNAPRE